MWPCQQYSWGLRGQGPDLMALPFTSCGTWNHGFVLCRGRVVVAAPLRPLVRTSGDGVCGVLARRLARSRCLASAVLAFLKLLLEEPSFQILCLLGATPPAFPSRIPHLEKEGETSSSHMDSSGTP